MRKIQDKSNIRETLSSLEQAIISTETRSCILGIKMSTGK